jgi:hypothetical protein
VAGPHRFAGRLRLRLPAASGRWHPAGSCRVRPWLVGGPRVCACASLSSERSWGSGRIRPGRALRPGTFLSSRGRRRAGVAGNVYQAVRRVHGRRVQHLFAPRASASFANRLSGAGLGRRDAEPLAVVVRGTRATPPVARGAPGLGGVRRRPAPPARPASGERVREEDDQTCRHETEPQGQPQSCDMARGILAEAPRNARAHQEGAQHDYHRAGRDEPHPHGG